ncbi:MAG: PAS domain-containing protein [Granulosicoccus sp.]|nr:PAS domain-containing protein [Granulosicoccus sp.]
MPTTEHDVSNSLKSCIESNCPNGLGQWTYHVDKQLYQCSAECCELRGIGESETGAEQGGHSPDEWLRGVHYADRSRVERVFNSLYCGDTKQTSVRYRICSDSIPWRWIMTRASVVNYSSSQIPALVTGVDIDVTEIYEELPENKLLREEAERSEIALASANQGLWYVDVRQGIRIQNDTWRTMRGYAADAGYGPDTHWKRDIHPDDLALVENVNNIRDMTHTDSIDYAYRQKHANGQWQWIWSRGRIIERDENFQPVVLIGTDTDVTPIKEAETRFERMSNTLEVAIKTAGMGVWEWNLDTQMNTWDVRTRDIFGATDAPELVSLDEFMKLVHPDDRQNVMIRAKDATNTHKDLEHDYRICHPIRGIRHIKAKAQCHYAVGEAPRYVGIVWDVTDRIAAEREREKLAENLNHVQRLQSLGELTGGIAHDVNNILAIISGNAELMALSLPQENAHLNAIIDASQCGSDLTQSLLAFSRKQSLQPALVNLGEMVRSLRMMIGRTLGANINLQTNVANDLWNCKVDPVQLENALINLIVNARDAMGEGGLITINLENRVVDDSFVSLTQQGAPGEFVLLSVEDTGKGMNKQILEKSIDPFFTTKNAIEGHGLGLSTIFGFVKQSNGHMMIESVEGRGATVDLYLPRYSDDTPNDLGEQLNDLNIPMGNQQTVLVVEDEPSVRQMVEEMLNRLNYRTISVMSAGEALRKLSGSDSQIDLILSDIVLPGDTNGFELGREVHRRYPEMRMFYVSGYARDALDQSGTDSRNVDVLRKPFTLRQLAERVAQTLAV